MLTKKNYAIRARRPRSMKKTDWLMSRMYRLLKTVNFLKSVVKPEMKKITYTYSNTYVSTTGLMIYLQPLSQGDTSTTREGDTVYSHHVDIRGRLIYGATPCCIRMFLFLDGNNTGANPAALDYLDVVNYYGFRQLEAVERFRTLYNNVFVVDDQRQAYINFNIYKKLGWRSTYSGNAGTVADARHNHLFMFVVSTTDENQPSIDFSHRFAYYDN